MALMTYGASGYTGRLLSEYAKHSGLDFILAGRNQQSIKSLAKLLDTPYRIFNRDDKREILSALKGVKVLINCAGPFSRTAAPLLNACTSNGVHYLDIAAELDNNLLADKTNLDAEKAGVMLLPGCGGSVAILGCLAGFAAVEIRAFL
jgi:short subunit dehydrogenase-like uncharacterized protein